MKRAVQDNAKFSILLLPCQIARLSRMDDTVCANSQGFCEARSRSIDAWRASSSQLPQPPVRAIMELATRQDLEEALRIAQ